MIVRRRLMSGYSTAVRVEYGSRSAGPIPGPAVPHDHFAQVVSPAQVVHDLRRLKNERHGMTRIMLRLPVVTRNGEEWIAQPPQPRRQLLVRPASNRAKTLPLGCVKNK